jgi:hypothetical protein
MIFSRPSAEVPMKLTSHAPRVFGLLVVLAALTACAQPRVQTAAGGEPTDDAVALLKDQVQSLERYSSQMERLYAAQEAEILRLRQEVATLRSSL